MILVSIAYVVFIGVHRVATGRFPSRHTYKVGLINIKWLSANLGTLFGVIEFFYIGKEMTFGELK